MLSKATLFFFLGGIFFFTPSATAWEIRSFDADLSVQSDGAILVRETIEADFQGESHHGIWRDIPLVTQDRMGLKRSIRLTFLGAEDEAGQKWKVSLTRQGVYQRLRMGDPEVTYSGRKTFQITYRVDRILQAFADHDELYWNVTGNDWAVPIRSAAATVGLPKPIPPGKLLSAATVGSYGSQVSDTQIVFNGKDTLHCVATRPLKALEGLTIVVGWPPGLVPMPTAVQKISWFFSDNWIFGVPLLTFLFMFLIWWKFGKDFPRGAITVEYEPPKGLTPAEVGALVDDKVDMKDITATLVDLARRGYLTIEQLPASDYVLTRTRLKNPSSNTPLKLHESLLLEGLFSSAETTTHLSDLENEFYQSLPGIRSALYEALAHDHYVYGRPDLVRRTGWGLSAGVFALAFAAPTFWVGSDPTAVIFSLCASAAIIALFAPFMPKKSWAGIQAMRKILGLEEFLRRTDQDRLKRESDPAALFERMLPYAMVLGIANQWAKAFEGIYQIRPTWYSSYGVNYFTPYGFTRQMNMATQRMGAILTSVPRSSGGSGFGGGFSGGGGGGGGGGAW